VSLEGGLGHVYVPGAKTVLAIEEDNLISIASDQAVDLSRQSYYVSELQPLGCNVEQYEPSTWGEGVVGSSTGEDLKDGSCLVHLDDSLDWLWVLLWDGRVKTELTERWRSQLNGWFSDALLETWNVGLFECFPMEESDFFGMKQHQEAQVIWVVDPLASCLRLVQRSTDLLPVFEAPYAIVSRARDEKIFFWWAEQEKWDRFTRAEI
jgi:hypothetical protein